MIIKYNLYAYTHTHTLTQNVLVLETVPNKRADLKSYGRKRLWPVFCTIPTYVCRAG
jgi:hypothetical protein